MQTDFQVERTGHEPKSVSRGRYGPQFTTTLGFTSMAQTVVTLMVFTPVAAAIGLLTYFLIERSRTVGPKPVFWTFISTVAFWAVGTLVFAGIVVSVGVGAFYESANAPFAIFVYGPPALAFGGIAGALRWRKEIAKPTARRDARKSSARPLL